MERTEADAVASISQKPFMEEILGVPHLVYPSHNGAWDHVSFAELMDKPKRKSGSVTIHDVDSFIDVAKEHGSLGNSNIYLDVDYVASKIVATAVFNDHGADDAGWKDHRAVFEPRQSAEWKKWLGNNGKRMTQSDLAAYLEANISDIVAPQGTKLPTGSDVLTFVSRLEETRTVKYGNAVNLQSGLVQLQFTEDNDEHTKGNLEVFKEFAIGVSPFFGGQGYSVKAFLRYRIDRNTAAITFWYELQRPEKTLEDACAELIKKIKEGTGIKVIFGTPPQ